MKKLKHFNKVIAMALAIIIFFSGFSVVTASALDIVDGFQARAEKYLVDLSATFDEATVGANPTYTLKSDLSWGLRWVKEKTYTNVFTGKKETVYANEVLPYYTVGGQMTWCIQPFVFISTHTYYRQGSGANSDYWDKVNAKSKEKYKEALARTIAFAKPKITAQNNHNNEYYHAARLILWEFIMGYRNPTTYDITSSNKLTKNVSCSTSTKRDHLEHAYNYIVEQLKDESKIPKNLNKSIAEAKANRLTVGKRINLNEKNHTKTKIIPNLTDYEWSSVKVVNQNGNIAGDSWGFKVAVNGNKVTVSAKKSIADENTTSRFYLRFTKKLDYKKSTSNVIYQAPYAKSQTMCNSLVYSNTVYAYYPIYEKSKVDTPETGSLQVVKSAIIKNGGEYKGGLNDWYFLVTNKTTKEKFVVSTGKSGDTDIVEEISLGTEMTVEELGQKITSNQSDYNNVTTYNNSSYGFPDGWESVTGPTTVTVNNSNDVTTVNWKNQYSQKMKVTINKSCDDNDAVDGYYFLVYDCSDIKPEYAALSKPIIVGPTNTEGKTEFELDNPINDILAVLELGKLKDGYSVPDVPTKVDVITGSYRQNFEIPSKYNKQNGTFEITGFSDAIPYTILVNEVKNLQKNIYIENTTSGYISINKTDSVNGKPVQGAVYEVYSPTQPAEDSNTNGEIIEDTTEAPTEGGTDENPEYIPDDDAVPEASEYIPEDDVVMGDGEEPYTPENLVCTITTDEDGYGISKLIPTGNYYVKEVSSPSNYALDTNVYDVNLTPGSNTVETSINLKLQDKPTQLVINKLEVSTLTTNGSQLSGAKIQVFEKPESDVIDYEKDTPVYEFTSTSKPEKLIGILEKGKTYIIHEASVPDGYCVSADVEKTISVDGSVDEVTLEDKSTIVKFQKNDSNTGDFVEGATLQITDKNGNIVMVSNMEGELVESWITTRDLFIVEGILKANEKYTLSEISAPDGYSTANPIDFTVNGNGESITIIMNDDTTKVSFSKTTLTGSEELEGCNLQVTDKDGNVIDSWTSGKEAHLIEGRLIVGETYTMTETKPADGYATAESITFTVADTGEVQTVTMKDDTTKVSFSKTTLTGSEELEGCNLQVTDKDGNIIDSWTSGKEAHLIEGKLIVGETYTMTETKPADGYATAESITFTVADTGEVQTVTMKDDTTKVSFSKTTLTGSQELEGCNLQVTDKDGNIIDSWTSGKEAHLIEGKLIVGETYTMTETKPADGYATAESITFTVADTGEVQKVTMKDDTIKVAITKYDITGDKELENAKISILDKNNTVIESWVSTTKAHLIEGKLAAGEVYTLHEEVSPDGYVLANDVKFTVLDTGNIQSFEMKDDTTKVEIVKLAGDTNKNLKNAKLQLKDTKGNVIDTWTTTDESHYIEGTLVAGKTYILSEVSAPKGYKKAEDIKFTVKTDGTKQIITMVDEKLSIEDPLPKTGGSSTNALFLAFGLTMMIAGFFIFCRAKTTKR